MQGVHDATAQSGFAAQLLSLGTDPDEEDPAPSGPEGDPRAAKRRILIVEDETFAVLYMADVVTEGGFEVVGTAASARDAIARADAERPDLVLMDIRLTGKEDGIYAATEIHRRFGIRSIFVSAFSDPATRRRAAAANPFGFIEKPFSPETLIAAVRAVF